MADEPKLQHLTKAQIVGEGSRDLGTMFFPKAEFGRRETVREFVGSANKWAGDNPGRTVTLILSFRKDRE